MKGSTIFAVIAVGGAIVFGLYKLAKNGRARKFDAEAKARAQKIADDYVKDMPEKDKKMMQSLQDGIKQGAIDVADGVRDNSEDEKFVQDIETGLKDGNVMVARVEDDGKKSVKTLQEDIRDAALDAADGIRDGLDANLTDAWAQADAEEKK